MTVIFLRADGVLPASPEPAVIEMLEEWLEGAKRGEICSVALVAVRPNGGVATSYLNTTSWLHHLKSGAATLGYRLDAENLT